MNAKVRNAVAAAIALSAAGTASAFDIHTFAGTPLLAGGSTAIDQALQAYFEQAGTNGPCDTTQDIDIYIGKTGTAGTTGGKFVAVACAPASGVSAAGTGIVFVKEDNGGSGNGINPVGQVAGTFLTFPNLSTLTAANCTSSTAIGALAGVNAAYTVHSCSGNYTNFTAFPNLGFADVDAGIFGIDTSATGINVKQFNDVDIVFAPYVSLGLYRALQQVEGLTANDDVANMPSLTTAELNGLFTQTVTSWTKIANASGTTVGSQSVVFGSSSGTQFGGAGGTTPVNQTVYICRRDNNSGTEKTAEIVLGNINCATGAQPFATRTVVAGHTYAPASGTTWVTASFNGTADTVFGGSGTGEVLKCLQGRDSIGAFAVGFASIDNPWGACQTLVNGAANSDREDTRPIKIDGVVPSLQNAAAGKYKFWAQSALYAPQNSATNFAGGDAGHLYTFMVTSTTTAIGTSAGLVAENNQFQYGTAGLCTSAAGFTGPNFDGGLLGPPSSSAAPNAPTANLAAFRGNPISSFVKAVGGTTNNCQKELPFGGTSVDAVGGGVNWLNP